MGNSLNPRETAGPDQALQDRMRGSQEAVRLRDQALGAMPGQGPRIEDIVRQVSMNQQMRPGAGATPAGAVPMAPIQGNPLTDPGFGSSQFGGSFGTGMQGVKNYLQSLLNQDRAFGQMVNTRF